MVLEHTLPLLQRMAKPSDIAVMNFAHWHNGWEGHEYRDLLQAFRDHVTAHADELPHIVWKQVRSPIPLTALMPNIEQK